jgi:GxxExxY protein
VKSDPIPPQLNTLSRAVVVAAIKVHSQLGPGLLESAYKECLYYELLKEGYRVIKEKEVPLVYGNVKLEIGCRIDLFVENSLIVEIKAVERLNDVHLAQVLTYLRLSGCRLGLLLNFNVLRLKDGIKRLIL